MHQLPHYRTKKITLWLSLASIMVFGTLIALQAYNYHEDTPQAQCYASIDFVYSTIQNIVPDLYLTYHFQMMVAFDFLQKFSD